LFFLNAFGGLSYFLYTNKKSRSIFYKIPPFTPTIASLFWRLTQFSLAFQQQLKEVEHTSTDLATTHNENIAVYNNHRNWSLQPPIYEDKYPKFLAVSTLLPCEITEAASPFRRVSYWTPCNQ
jgi:hypothetical protein